MFKLLPVKFGESYIVSYNSEVQINKTSFKTAFQIFVSIG